MLAGWLLDSSGLRLVRDEEKFAVSEDTVDVKEEKLDFTGARFRTESLGIVGIL